MTFSLPLEDMTGSYGNHYSVAIPLIFVLKCNETLNIIKQSSSRLCLAQQELFWCASACVGWVVMSK